MKLIRVAIILILILLIFLRNTFTAYAQTPRPMFLETLPGSNPGDAHIIENKILSFISGSGLLPIKKIADYFIKIKYKDDINMPLELRRIGTKMKNVFSGPLLPKALQDSLSTPYDGEKLAANKLTADTGYRLCAPGSDIESDGTKITDSAPLPGINFTEDYIGKNDPENPYYWYDNVTFSQLGSSLLARGKAVSLDYYTPESHLAKITDIQLPDGDIMHKADVGELENVLYKCEDAATGTRHRELPTKATGVVQIGGGYPFQFIINFFRSRFATRACDTNDKLQGCADAKLSVRTTDAIAGLPMYTSSMIGVVDSDLSQKAPPESRKKIVDDGGGGFLNTFWSGSLPKMRKTNARVKQIELVNGSEKPRESNPRWIQGVTEGYSCVTDNLLLPLAVKKAKASNCSLTDQPTDTSDWALSSWSGTALGATFHPPAGDIQNAIVAAAQNASIPQCALEGVGFIEGAYSWPAYDPANPRIAQCVPNVCSAAGPFQITTGVDAQGDSSCPRCPSSWVKQYGCPDIWQDSRGSPCDYPVAAQSAAEILKYKANNYGYSLSSASPKSQKDAIIAAGTGYYGSNAPVGRLGGCSYGEFVYKHCDPSYSCRAQYPQ